MSELRYSGPSYGPITRALLEQEYEHRVYATAAVFEDGAWRSLTAVERAFHDALYKDLLKINVKTTRYIIDNVTVHSAKGQAPFPISRVHHAVVELMGGAA